MDMSKIKIDQLIRSSRRTFSLEITAEARLVVRVPRRARMAEIEDVLFKKSSWILSKQELIQKKRAEMKPKEFVDGESFLYLGRSYKLKRVEEPSVFRVEDGFFLSRDYFDSAKRIFTQWYQARALEKITERVEWHAGLAGLSYQSIKLSNAVKRWGSCSTQGRLCFSWRLIMAPLSAIDYVVVHELAHLKEQNHSRAFWRRVAEMLPSYKQDLVWLESYQHLLNV